MNPQTKMTNSSFFVLQKTELSALLDEKLDKFHQQFAIKDELVKLKLKLGLEYLTDCDLLTKFNEILNLNSNLSTLIQSEFKEKFFIINQTVHTQAIRIQTEETNLTLPLEQITPTTPITPPTTETPTKVETYPINQEDLEEVQDADYYCKMGEFYYNQNKNNEAWIQFEKALAIDSNYSNAISGKGLILNERKDYRGAIELFDKAISINDRDPDYYYNRGNLN